MITSGKVIVCMGLVALVLSACGGEDAISGTYSTSTSASTSGEGGGGGAIGTGGAGGQGGSMAIPDVEQFWCDPEDGIVADAEIKGTVNGPMGGVDFDYEYIPNHLTISAGQIVKFTTVTSTQNMTSGEPPEHDGKFETPQGRTHCLKFNVAGTYPFWSIDCWPSDPMLGKIDVK